MLSLLINNLHVQLYSGVSIGIVNRLGSVVDFNVSSILLIKISSTICWTDQMGKSPCWRGQWSGIKILAESSKLLSLSSGGYEVPNIGCKYILYSHGTTKANVMFETMNAKLACYVSVQS